MEMRPSEAKLSGVGRHQAAGDHGVAGLERMVAAGQFVGQPDQRLEGVAHHVAAVALADLLVVDLHHAVAVHQSPGSASRLRDRPAPRRS